MYMLGSFKSDALYRRKRDLMLAETVFVVICCTCVLFIWNVKLTESKTQLPFLMLVFVNNEIKM